jgi:hypothetical protein
VPALLALVAVLLAANLVNNASAQTRNTRPPQTAYYMMQAKNDFANNATFALAPGYRLLSAIPCNGSGGPYGQGAYLCMIEKQEH